MLKGKRCLNTSHVSVQAHIDVVVSIWETFKYITCVGSSGIEWHHIKECSRFKYITCVGSRRGCDYDVELDTSLNTSHVSVQATLLNPEQFLL